MTGFTDSLDILTYWDMGPIRSFEALPPNESAPLGNVAFVETTSGARYVLKRETLRRTQPQEYLLLEALAAQGVPVAIPIRARSG